MRKFEKVLAISFAVVGIFVTSFTHSTPLDRPEFENTGQSIPIAGEPTCVAPGFTCDGNG